MGSGHTTGRRIALSVLAGRGRLPEMTALTWPGGCPWNRFIDFYNFNCENGWEKEDIMTIIQEVPERQTGRRAATAGGSPLTLADEHALLLRGGG